MVCEEARKLTRECGGAVSPAALVPAIVRDLRVLGPSAWHRLVDLLLAPQLPLSIGTTSVNNAEELIWQVRTNPPLPSLPLEQQAYNM
jgi:hypothetical protein